jgi:hypothetical protein
LHEGLSVEIEIDWCGTVVMQCLYFLGVLFSCSVCKKIGHLRHHCQGQKKEEVFDGYVDLGKTGVVDSEMITDGWPEHNSFTIVDRDIPMGKPNNTLPSVINSPYASLKECKINVGLKSLKLVKVSLEGFGSSIYLVCEDPLMSKMKDSEVLSQFLCPEGRKDLGRDMGNLIVKSLVIGGEEIHIVEDDSLKVRGIGGELNLSEGRGGHMGEGCVSSKGSYT